MNKGIIIIIIIIIRSFWKQNQASQTLKMMSFATLLTAKRR